MLCEWCGKETPDESAFCKHCGKAFADAASNAGTSSASNAEDGAKFQEDRTGEGVDMPGADAESGPANASDVSNGNDMPSEEPEDELPEFAPVRIRGEFEEFASRTVRPISRSLEDVPLVDLPSVPEQPVLSKGRIAVISVIATLFAVAIVLLVAAILVRVLGL